MTITIWFVSLSLYIVVYSGKKKEKKIWSSSFCVYVALQNCAFESLGYSSLSHHPLPCEPLFHIFLKVYKTCHKREGQDTYQEQFPQVWVYWFEAQVNFLLNFFFRFPYSYKAQLKICSLTSWKNELYSNSGDLPLSQAEP